jgi:adenylyltransferase/sulfurtransferase
MSYELSNREIRRYNKQIAIPEIGHAGQLKLKNASILVVGAGGLGCPALQYLSASGIGRIAIIDYDIVDETNLARQTLYGSDDLGKLKSIIAKRRLEYLNPLCEYTIINRKIDDAESLDVFRDYDVIIDATDNPEARYVINDACVLYMKPMVHGSIYRHEGMISVFNYKGGPSYRDFNPSALEYTHRNPDNGNEGFFGMLPGITGMHMANEAIKIITGSGDVLSGCVLVFNIYYNTYNTFYFRNSNKKQGTSLPAGNLVQS